MICKTNDVATTTHAIKTSLDKTKALITGAGSGLSRTRYAREAAGHRGQQRHNVNESYSGARKKFFAR
jgi:hypothetical protein